jgi:hypothetical protein
MINKYEMNEALGSFLNSIEISHLFARDYRHGIETPNGWDMFEPTRFIYAFFAFNMIYEIDWHETMKKGILQKHNSYVLNAKAQMDELTKFLWADGSCGFESALLQFDREKELFSDISLLDADKNSNRPSTKNKSKLISEVFKESSKKFSCGLALTIEDHFNLLEMSYAVRNNIFHGNKKATKMKENGHRKRLFHYGNIILATNETFFELLRNSFSYCRVQNYEVVDNQ